MVTFLSRCYLSDSITVNVSSIVYHLVPIDSVWATILLASETCLCCLIASI